MKASALVYLRGSPAAQRLVVAWGVQLPLDEVVVEPRTVVLAVVVGM